MTGDEQTNEELKKSDDSSSTGSTSNSANSPGAPAPVAKSVFSDDFDDPARRDPEDELPDEEPLTPELVEEEAIRGDFMLRWAAIFLAVLMAFSQINDTKPLVLIRSGDAMRANGFLPSRVDQFSMTMDGQSVANVSWLFDHLVSLSWLVGGDKGLTVLKALLAGISAFLLVRISIPGVSSWWTSICAVFAIVACSTDFMPVPELITVLGMTQTMRLLVKHRLGKAEGLIWKLPVLIAIWCNFDSHAWVGAGVVFAYAVGSAISGRIAARKQSLAAVAEQKTLLLPALLGVVALLVNPFHINSLLAPLTTYSTEYPAMAAQRKLTTDAARIRFDGRVDFFSILNPDAVQLFDHSHVAGIALLLMAAVVLLLARSTRDLGFLMVFLFVLLLSLIAAHELPAASIAAAVIAGIVAQDWYRRSFNMQYSTDSRELMFSRGGRAATVLGLAMIGFCVVASRLPGAVPLGFGFDKETRVTIDTFREQLEELDPEAKILHTLVEQGDMLIWSGRKSFVDSRVTPFGRRDDLTSVFGKHGAVLDSMLLVRADSEPPTSSDPKEKEALAKQHFDRLALAQKALDEYRISHIITRLAPPGPADFTSVRNLTETGGWLRISVGPSAAILERMTATMTQAKAEKIAFNLPRLAFRDSDLPSASLRQVATAPSFYEKHVYRTRKASGPNRRMGLHYLKIASTESQAPFVLSALNLAIRHLNLSLNETPDDLEVYNALGQCYAMTRAIEQMLQGETASQRIGQIRYLQAVMAFRQATVIEPSDKSAWQSLHELYMQRNRLDLALECLETWLKLEDEVPQGSGDEYEDQITGLYQRRTELKEQMTQSEEQLKTSIERQLEGVRKQKEAEKSAKESSGEAKTADEAAAEESMEVVITAMSYSNAGQPRKALESIRGQSDTMRANPLGSILLGQLLLEAGDLEEAHRMLSLMSQEALKQPEVLGGIDWQLYTGISQLGIGDYPSADETWKSQLNLLDRQITSGQAYGSVLYSLPLIADANLAVNEVLPVWPFRNCTMSGEVVKSMNEGRAEISLLLGLIQLEEGNLEKARKSLSRIITEYGSTQASGLATLYYSMMDEKARSLFEQHSSMVWEEFEYPGEVVPAVEGEASSTKPPMSDLLPRDGGNNSTSQPGGTPRQ
ncbi:MAG: tetratricopeptide repeat protein [Planctomycetaceae bacterium]